MEERATDGEITVYENQNTLPIGYAVNDDILTFDTGDNGPFTVQNELCGALTGIQPIFCTIYDDMQTSTYGTNVQVTLQDDYNASYTGGSSGARADMIYRIPYDMDLYVSCQGSNVYKIALLIDGNECAFDRYQNQLFRVGNVTAGQLVDIQFVLDDGEDMSGTLYCYPMEYVDSQFQAFYDIMEQRSMTVTSHSDTQIEGRLELSEGEVFMTSIPYDEGWTLYANGEQVDTCVLLEGFLGAELAPGSYTIKLVYRCPGLALGAVLTLLGILCFFVIGMAEMRMRGEPLRSTRRKRRK
jgi:uncharacterized membrane protein YfhO